MRHGGRPGNDRRMVSFWLEAVFIEEVDKLAAQTGRRRADVYRDLIALGLAGMPKPQTFY